MIGIKSTLHVRAVLIYNRAQIKGHKTGECGILLVGGCGHACTTAAIALEHV